MMTLLCAVFSVAWGQEPEVTYDFTSGWSVSNGSLTNGTITFTGSGTNFKVNDSGYFYMGKSGAYINFPTYDFDVEKIEVVGNSGASASTKMNIFVGNTAVSTETTGSTGTNSYEINTSYQGSGTQYTLKVTSAHNAQITQIKIYKKGSAQPTGDAYYVAGSWTNPTWGDGKIQMTKKSNGTYTLTNLELPEGAEFKIIKIADGSTDLVWYGGEGNNKYWLTLDNHTDISLNGEQNLYMPIAGTWNITVDPTGNTPKLTVEGWPELAYYLVGDFNEWAITDSYKFSKVGNTDEYTLNKTIKKGEKFKIKDNYGTWYGAVSNGDFYVEENMVKDGEEQALSILKGNDGQNFYMNLSNKNYWTLDFSPANLKLTLRNYISDAAELPFEFDKGRTAIESEPGLTASGLGSDYSSSPKLKFTAANNAVILHFDERPGTLSYDIKGNPSSGASSIVGEFVVQTSVDGITYTDLKSYTTLGSTTLSEKFDNLDENVRYIKWLYKTRTSGNVALGNIKLEKYVAPQPYTVTITPNDNAEIFVFFNNSENTLIESGDQVLSGSEVLVSVSANEGYLISGVTVTDGEGQSVTLTEVEGEEGFAWTFIMPKSDVTVACTTIKENYEKWVKTDLADLTSDDIFVIVGKKGDENYAMSNDKGTSSGPDAVKVVVIQDKIVSSTVADKIKWNISGNATDGYTFYPNGDNEKWLYATNTNNGVRVGTNDNKAFTIKDNYLYNTATSRYIGIYNTADWRCYESINSNITGQTFAFYKLVKPAITVTSSDIELNYDATSGEIDYSIVNPIDNKSLSATTDADWISNISVEADKVTFETSVNNGPERTATITLAYAGAEDVTVNVTQEAAPDTPFTLTISSSAGDGDKYYATMSAIGNGNFVVPEGIEASAITVENNKIKRAPIYGAGQVLDGKEAYLIETISGENLKSEYVFEPTDGDITYGINDNWLYPATKGVDISGPDPTAEYKYYQLSLNSSHAEGSVGFYYGPNSQNGEAFAFKSDHKAFLAVPVKEGTGASIGLFDGFDGIADAIVNEGAQRSVYTLTGVRVDSKQLPKGIYIIDGKKQVVK